MIPFRHLSIVFITSIVSSAFAADVPKTLHLASLEWLPYSGSILPNDGLSGEVINEVTKAFGSTIKISYFPWKEAVSNGETDPSFSGYFPVWKSPEREKKCYFSGPIGTTTTGIGYLKDDPVTWTKPSDLTAITFGVVDGYTNGEAFDAAVKQGSQHVIISSTDTNNIKKLVSKAVPAIVIDKQVLFFMTLQSPIRGKIMFYEKPFLERTVHVCFQRTPAGKSLQEAFDMQLKKLDIPKMQEAYFKKLEANAK
ncbi:substrate-binding periplasmic protein [Undibacterium sp. Dicai25W]|uniref:substrate-binding periplasmic protein n=1 Tax=Undibacterium sp. Dicai25W TaxID=3413034 RepID=UPI003BF2C674